MAFSGYNNQRRRTDEGVEETKRKRKGADVCGLWFLKKETEETNEQGGKRTRGQNKGAEGRETEPVKILVHQPAAPRAVTTIVFVLNGEDWVEKQGETGKEATHRAKTQSQIQRRS